MESSGGNHQPGAQNEPFFDLLQSSAPPGLPNSSHNIPKKMESATEFNFGSIGSDDVLPSFDFQPIRTSAPSSSTNMSSPASTMKIDDKDNRGREGSPPSCYTSYEPMVRRSREPPPTYETPVTRSQEHEKESFDSATAAAVERTMKKYADNLLRVLEGMTGRLSQLESSTQRLELLFGDIKNMVTDTHGEADGKLRSLENHILEVHRGVQVLRDRQEIFEAQSQLAKLQLSSKSESIPIHNAPSAPCAPTPVPEPSSQLTRAPSVKAIMEAPPQQVSDTPSSSYYQPQPQLQLQQMPSLPAPPQPQPPPQQHQQPQQQLQLQQHPQQSQQPVQIPQQGVLQSEGSHQMLHHQQPPPPQQLTHPSQHPPHPPPQYSQQQQQQQQPPPPPPPPSNYSQQQQPVQQPTPMPNYGHTPEAPPYSQHPQAPHPGPHHAPLPPSSYPADLPTYHPSYGPSRQQQPPQMPSQQQQQPPHNPGMYELPMGRSGSGHLPAPPYGQQPHPMSGAPHYESQTSIPGSGYPGSSYRVAQPVPSAPSGASGGYPRLPVAQPVAHALPNTGPPSSGAPLSTNKVPIEEVIDKVTAMGFPKDSVRGIVRRLTENGQSVDLNIVLDKLMNGESSSQATPKGWFGR